MYFQNDEINKIQTNQQKNQFADLEELKNDMREDTRCLSNFNLINIMDWQPKKKLTKEELKARKQKKASKRIERLRAAKGEDHDPDNDHDYNEMDHQSENMSQFDPNDDRSVYESHNIHSTDRSHYERLDEQGNNVHGSGMLIAIDIE